MISDGALKMAGEAVAPHNPSAQHRLRKAKLRSSPGMSKNYGVEVKLFVDHSSLRFHS
jgi:hypothetical protein